MTAIQELYAAIMVDAWIFSLWVAFILAVVTALAWTIFITFQLSGPKQASLSEEIRSRIRSIQPRPPGGAGNIVAKSI